MWKKIISLLLVVVLTATVAIGGTMAYYIDRDENTNTFNLSPDVDITLDEAPVSKEGDEYVADEDADRVKENTYEDIYPGAVMPKDPTVHLSENSADAYVRAKVTLTGGMNWLYGVYGGLDEAAFLKLVDNTLGTGWEIVNSEINFEPTRDLVFTINYTDVLSARDSTTPVFERFIMPAEVTSELMNTFFGSDNKYQINVVAEAIQADGFDSVEEAFDAHDGKNTGGVEVTPENIDTIDFTAANQNFVLSGTFEDVVINELGDGSVLEFDDATVGTLTLGDDAEITGKAAIESISAARNSTEPVELKITDAELDVTGEVGVRNTDGKSILNIENTSLEAGTIFVGEHTQNHTEASAEFNVANSYISCEENSLGSTIAVWGKSGVDSKIADSEIHTYSRGWHQSEDANDNSITFQGGDHINVDIDRTNMHLYGARSIINARKYGSGDCAVDFKIDDSLIWVVTKSTHGEETLPVWGATEINDSMLLFTKDRNAATPVFKSFVYGNPVIHGNYAVTTQCGWNADIVLADDQTVTFAEGANVSIYEGAGKVQFVCSDEKQVVVKEGATLTNIGVADSTQ